MTKRRPHWTASTVLAALALAVPLLAGCDQSSDGDDKGAGDSTPVIAPKRPGESARTVSPEDAKRAGEAEREPNSADVAYVNGMIVHHGQAITMTDLAEKYATDSRVKAIAERIAAAQGPEIKAMRGWLKGVGREESSGHQHHSGSPRMAGMATKAQLAQLRKARGEKFDRLFLKLMITHHKGALSMVRTVRAQGNDVRVEEMADGVRSSQTVEIARMRKAL
ncbi:DUF305 domain-containing protein [Streptomyces sp. NPDC005438]|uniref:DUF305 domain-containing protein n=1 Tax=Streptomyces sp. NPDC005438 TaxID=3156880 RepID=UPI0033A28C2B